MSVGPMQSSKVFFSNANEISNFNTVIDLVIKKRFSDALQWARCLKYSSDAFVFIARKCKEFDPVSATLAQSEVKTVIIGKTLLDKHFKIRASSLIKNNEYMVVRPFINDHAKLQKEYIKKLISEKKESIAWGYFKLNLSENNATNQKLFSLIIESYLENRGICLACGIYAQYKTPAPFPNLGEDHIIRWYLQRRRFTDADKFLIGLPTSHHAEAYWLIVEYCVENGFDKEGVNFLKKVDSMFIFSKLKEKYFHEMIELEKINKKFFLKIARNAIEQGDLSYVDQSAREGYGSLKLYKLIITAYLDRDKVELAISMHKWGLHCSKLSKVQLEYNQLCENKIVSYLLKHDHLAQALDFVNSLKTLPFFQRVYLPIIAYCLNKSMIDQSLEIIKKIDDVSVLKTIHSSVEFMKFVDEHFRQVLSKRLELN
ncbi:MAG: hypothetical protein JHC93_07885 [Parachlamydiales bacterium]|nr:hypothetical protein [Parachlamydiales bacterium]